MQSALALQTADDAGKHTTAAGNRGPLVYGFGDEPAEGTKVPDADDDDDGRRVPVTAPCMFPACIRRRTYASSG